MSEQWSNEKLKFLGHEGHALALGGPGAGKTHVALVKARNHIRAGSLKPGQKVLFLSFARATVARILQKASELISRDELKRLEISTYHAFAWDILRSHAYLLTGRPQLRLLAPPEAAAHLASFPKHSREAEKMRLFIEDATLDFDLFARMVAELLQSSGRLAELYGACYPVVILDEFQDTNADEWAMIQQLGKGSRLLALGDPDQRIYEFRGADPRRLKEFADAFSAKPFDFAGENHRSSGTDINTFGNDLLYGKNVGKAYQDVRVVKYGFINGKSPFFHPKTQVLSAFQRLKKLPEKSIAVLVPSRQLMVNLSAYLQSELDGLPAIRHDVAMDVEAPALAAGVLAALMEGGPAHEATGRVLRALHSHIRGRRGSRPTPQPDLDLAEALSKFMLTGKVTGSKRKLVVSEVQRVVAERGQLTMAGDAGVDWLRMRDMFAGCAVDVLTEVAKDVGFLRLLHRGSALRAGLGELWRAQGHYGGAESAVRSALVQEQFAAVLRDWRGVHLMTIHKAKGKEFDEVIIYDGLHQRLVRNPEDEKAVAQERLALRVAVTRASRRATILTPKKGSCPLL